jgi:hypothetical protein
VYKQEISIISTSSPVNMREIPEDGPDEAPVVVKPPARTVVVERRGRIRSSG